MKVTVLEHDKTIDTKFIRGLQMTILSIFLTLINGMFFFLFQFFFPQEITQVVTESKEWLYFFPTKSAHVARFTSPRQTFTCSRQVSYLLCRGVTSA